VLVDPSDASSDAMDHLRVVMAASTVSNFPCDKMIPKELRLIIASLFIVQGGQGPPRQAFRPRRQNRKPNGGGMEQQPQQVMN